MLLPLVDSLRCPASHEESALVLSVDSWSGQRISRGTLGCPICHARYLIEDGTVHFADNAPSAMSDDASDVDPGRLAAQLGLAEPGGVILLAGRYAGVHAELEERCGVVCILANTNATTTDDSVRIVISDRVPLAAGLLRGAAVSGLRSMSVLSEVARCLRPRGRLVAARDSEAPDGIRELARDQLEWVGEREDSAPVVQLGRARLR